MFDFFRKKPVPVPCADFIWVTGAEKQKGFLELLHEHPNPLILAWFPETQAVFQACLSESSLPHTVHLAKSGSIGTTHSTVIFLEHYPVLSKEQELLAQFPPLKVLFINSLDEPLLRLFNGEKIVEMLRKMGHQEGEAISHNMISSSIRKAQEKTEKQAGFVLTHHAWSAEEWFDKYVKEK